MIDHRYPDVLPDSTRATAALEFFLRKYRDCQNNHVTCKLLQPSTTLKSYPTRLLDVGESEESLIRLRDQALDDEGPYACLSHCWGQKKPLKLTRLTKSMLEEGITLSVLPRTFQDAIFVTRKLRIRFLWIDSLYANERLLLGFAEIDRCIFQDDPDDWSIEASRMSAVYSKAACTIAATAAKDSDGGLFFKRNPRLQRPLLVKATWNRGSHHKADKDSVYPISGLYWCDIEFLQGEAVEQAPLNSRAWVSQERQLSPRIIHFSNTQLFWECHESQASENYPTNLPYWGLPNWYEGVTMLKQHLYRFALDKADAKMECNTRFDSVATSSEPINYHWLYFSWCAFRIHYTGCGITKDQDKLVAIQGIAKQVGQELNDRLIAGLWSKRIPEEMCWFKRLMDNPPCQEPTKWRAPTWSWASSNAIIFMSGTTQFHGNHEDKQILVDVVDLDVKTKPSGELEHASIRLQCKLLPAIIEPLLYYGYDREGVLTLSNSKVNSRAVTHSARTLDICMDDLNQKGPYHGLLMFTQHCPHTTPYGKYACSVDTTNRIKEDVHASSSVAETADAIDVNEDSLDEDDADEKCTEIHDMHSDNADEDNEIRDRKDCIEGLILVPEDGRSNTFKRIGMFAAYGTESVKKILTEHSAAEDRIITLI